MSIYSEYFKILEKYFSAFYKASIDENISPATIANDVKDSPNLLSSFESVLPNIKSDIDRYWSSNYSEVYKLCNSLPAFKARFGGDIGPQKVFNTIERVSVYFDTIIIPDPIYRILYIPAPIETISFYLVKYAINQLMYKEAYICDLNPPIALLVPDNELLNNKKKGFQELINYGSIDSVLIMNKLFNKNLDSYDQCLSFLQKFENIDHVYREIIERDIIFWDETVSRDLSEQLESNKRKAYEHFNKEDFPFDVNDPRFLLFQINGRMMQVNDALVRSHENMASPLIKAPVSYHWLKQKIKANQSVFLDNKYESINLGVTNALLSEQTDWLGNLSLEQVTMLRKNSSITDLRQIINAEMEVLSNLDITNLEVINNQVDYNLNNAFIKHRANLEDITTELKRDITYKGISLLASATIALQPLVGNFLPIWSSYVGGLTGLSSISDVITSVKNFLKERKKLKQSPIGILFESK